MLNRPLELTSGSFCYSVAPTCFGRKELFFFVGCLGLTRHAIFRSPRERKNKMKGKRKVFSLIRRKISLPSASSSIVFAARSGAGKRGLQTKMEGKEVRRKAKSEAD